MSTEELIADEERAVQALVKVANYAEGLEANWPELTNLKSAIEQRVKAEVDELGSKMLVEREDVESWLEIIEGIWHPCTVDCECLIHTIRRYLGEPDDAEARRA